MSSYLVRSVQSHIVWSFAYRASGLIEHSGLVFKESGRGKSF